MVWSVLPVLCLAAAQSRPAPEFRYDPADSTVKAVLAEGPNRYDPSLGIRDDVVYIAFLEFTAGEGDRVLLGQLEAGEITNVRAIESRPGRYAAPTVTCEPGGPLWVTYEAERGGQWDVVAVPISDDGVRLAPRVVSDSPGPDINHRVSRDAEGNLWVAWQAAREGMFEIRVRRVRLDGIDAPERLWPVSDGGTGCGWRPDVVACTDGTVIVAWDAYGAGGYNVYAASFHAGRWSPVLTVAGSLAFEGRARLAARAGGGAWLAWEEGEREWGAPYRSRLISGPARSLHMSDENGPLHRFRQVRLARLTLTNGQLRVDDGPGLPMPAVEAATQRANAPASVKLTGAFYEAPQLVSDRGGVWVVYRHMYLPWLGVTPDHHVQEDWGLYARRLDETGWSPLVRFDIGQGDGMQRIATAESPDGPVVAWATGRMDRRDVNARRGIAFARVQKPTGASVPAGTSERPEVAVTSRPAPSHPAPTATLGDKPHEVVFGDLHRHTDLSLCFVPSDGTIEDAYRYAIDVAQLDFLGVTDHTHDLAMGDGKSLIWWRSAKEVARHELAPRFYPMYAYERSRGDTDHNVISLRDDVLRPHTYPHPQFWKELDNDSFMIPHQPFDRRTFAVQDERRRPLLEIYQGCRDRSVEEDAHAGLDRGYRLGFIASSDHLSTSASYAGVWTPGRTREAIFRSLQARRTFGATAKISVLLTAGKHVMGDRWSAKAMPEVRLRAGGTAPIEKVEFLVDGQVRHTVAAGESVVDLRYQPDPVVPGVHYLYARLTQADGNQAWSSPIWIEVE